MPSYLLGGAASGGTNLLSGNFWSGVGALHPYSNIRLKADNLNSGYVYIAFSGGMTIKSGGLNTSGFANNSGFMDGSPLAAGEVWFVPRLAVAGISGAPILYAAPDAAGSGHDRIFMEVL